MSRSTREPISVTPAFDPVDMARRGRIGAHRLHATHDSRETTAASRAVIFARFEHEVDPAGELPPEERRRRAEHARRAHMLRLARLSALARAKANEAAATKARAKEAEETSGPAEELAPMPAEPAAAEKARVLA